MTALFRLMFGGMNHLWMIGILLIATSCTHPVARPGGIVEYQERGYGRLGHPLRIENLCDVLKTHAKCTGTIDLASRALHLTVSEPPPWGLPNGQVRIGHSSDLWRLRGKKIGYLNLFLIRRDAAGKRARIIRKQLGENGEMYPDHRDLLKFARPGDLILGMWDS